MRPGYLTIMLGKMRQLFLVLLVLSSPALSEARALAGSGVKPCPVKVRYYPLARDYRRKIVEKIEAPSLVSASLPIYHFNLPSWRFLLHESQGDSCLLSSSNPSNLLMSLQP